MQPAQNLAVPDAGARRGDALAAFQLCGSIALMFSFTPLPDRQ